MPIIGSWNQTVELSFYLNLNFSRLKWQKNLNFTSEFITLRAIFFLSGHVDFSRWAGDLCFKLVASAKILVAMATKVVATWRVASMYVASQIEPSD